MMHLYSAFIVYCCTPKALYNHGGGGLSSTTTSVQHPPGWCDGSHRTTVPVRSPHTSDRWRGERVIEPIGWGLLGGHDWQGPVEGIWPGHRGYIPTLYDECHGFLMTTESQDLGLTSHPKDGWLIVICQIVNIGASLIYIILLSALPSKVGLSYIYNIITFLNVIFSKFQN